ncbi:MAG: 3-oxoacid CoA-transferase [Dehalococcoidia bacterium]
MAYPNKLLADAQAAVTDIADDASVCVGGFGTPRSRPLTLLRALAEKGPRGLTLIANAFPYPALAEKGLARKFIGSFVSSAYQPLTPWEERILSGEMEFEVCPQGILAERLRAGAAGIPAFYSPVGVDTDRAQGRERRAFDGREYILEAALRPDFALVRAHTADTLGNLAYRGSTLNFHPAMAAAARMTIAEVDEVVPAGAIAPQEVVVPCAYVDRLVLAQASQEELEALSRPIRERLARLRRHNPSPRGLSQRQMARRAAQELRPGQVVNLGLGLPALVSEYVTPDSGVLLQAENGLMGYGPFQPQGQEEWDIYNASSQPVTLFPGASFFDSVGAFTMARGGRVDVVVLGAFQVSEEGDLANWRTPQMVAGGIGGAMDLVCARPQVIVIMEHTTRDGQPRILRQCTYPLTGRRCVSAIVTNLAFIQVTAQGLLLRELAPGVTVDEVQAATEPPLRPAPDLKETAV